MPTQGDLTYTVANGEATVTGWVGTRNNTPITIVVPNTLGGYPVTKTGHACFGGNTYLGTWMRGCTLPDTVTYIAYGTFGNIWGMTSFNIPDAVTYIGDFAFQNTAISSIVIPWVTYIGDFAFDGCHGLSTIAFTGLDIPTVGYHWIYQNSVGLTGHAYSCSHFPGEGASFEGLLMGTEFEPDTSGDYKFIWKGDNTIIVEYTGSDGEVSIPDNLDDGPVVGIWDDSFYANATLVSVTIPEDVMIIGDAVFYDCTSLSSITFTGLTAPTSVGVSDWIHNTSSSIEGHADVASDFPIPGEYFNGLLMGDTIAIVPGAPTALSGIAHFESVALTWTAPADDGGADVDYYIVSKDGNPFTWHVITTATTVIGLVNGTEYSFKVKAHNRVGLSDYSNELVIAPYMTLLEVYCHTVPTAGEAPYNYTWNTNPVLTTATVSYFFTDLHELDVISQATSTEDKHTIGRIHFNNLEPTLDADFAVSVKAEIDDERFPVTITYTPTITGGTAPYTYAWQFEEDGKISNTVAPSFTYASMADIMVFFTITDSLGVSVTMDMEFKTS